VDGMPRPNATVGPGQLVLWGRQDPVNYPDDPWIRFFTLDRQQIKGS
jgi:hypothetical protein